MDAILVTSVYNEVADKVSYGKNQKNKPYNLKDNEVQSICIFH